MKVIVTTAGRTNEEMVVMAQHVASDLHVPFVVRKKESIKDIQVREDADVLIVGKERLEIHPHGSEEPVFFHPNSAMFRVKRVLRGETEPFLEATKLEKGMSFLDCTFGLGSDSIVASVAVGKEGRVVGTEGNRYLTYLCQRGLKSWESDVFEMDEAMKRIQLHHQNFEAFLRCCEDNSFDVVYFDPMFPDSIEESDGIKGLKSIALYSSFTEEVIKEAKRVAKQRIVLKDHWKSERFDMFSFHVYKRKTAKFHFGVIELT
ncbi:class I SAM-dependent methyltransferase [Bacillus sp. CGMCC 1.16541]|uniref:class I SAM-dependent methyltransferase n=1 Tax=Bacillus sp. CGMCC 1.16541 TaxID=2185143 RepID=UPI000D73674F|nr:class I SAM-dependent methyltransferase [Bacillus sp. CGMCC 1.16541]